MTSGTYSDLHSRVANKGGHTAANGSARRHHEALAGSTVYTTSWSSLPLSILESVAKLLNPTSRGIAKHVSREIYDASMLDETSSAAQGVGNDNRLCIEQLCCSEKLVKWAVAQGCPWTPHDFLLVAAETGSIEVLRWARTQQGCTFDELATAHAALGGQLRVLKWLRAEGCPWDVRTVDYATQGGFQDLVAFAMLEGCPWDEETAVLAAEAGNLAAVAVALQQERYAEGMMTEAAATGGHLHVLSLLRQYGVPWGEDTALNAAEGGHLAVLQWLREEGCPWEEEDLCQVAARRGHLHILRWLRAISAQGTTD